MIDWLDKLQKQFSGFDEKEDFQVINMNHKLKSIQKQKHRNNFKNIESFSVLNNENMQKKIKKKKVTKKELEPFDKMSSIFTNGIENFLKSTENENIKENFGFRNSSSENSANKQREIQNRQMENMQRQMETQQRIMQEQQERSRELQRQQQKMQTKQQEKKNEEFKMVENEIENEEEEEEQEEEPSFTESYFSSDFLTTKNNSDDNEQDKKEELETTEDNVIRNNDDIDLNDKSNTKTWEGQGIDDPNVNEMSIEQVKKKIREGIQETYDYMYSFQKNFADAVTDTLSNNNANENDRELIRDFLSSIICAFISIPITYNWYFLQYYSNDHSELNIPHLTMDQLKKQAKEDDNMWLFMYFFEFAMWIPSTLDYFLTDVIPHFTMKYFNGKLNFIIVFFSVYYFVKNHTETLKDLFIDLLSENTENGLLTFLFIVIIFVYLKNIPPSDPFEILYAYMNPITFAINVLIRFIITLLLAVPIGALISVAYLYTHTIGSIPLFSKYDYLKSIEEINLYIKEKKSTFEIQSCEDETFFQRMIKSIMRLFGLFQDYLLPIILFYILIDYTIKIRNRLSNVEGIFGNFKLSFVLMNIILIVSLATLMYPAFSEKFSFFIRSENK